MIRMRWGDSRLVRSQALTVHIFGALLAFMHLSYFSRGSALVAQPGSHSLVRAALTSSYYYLTSQRRQAVANNASRSAHSKTSNNTARVERIISAPYAFVMFRC
jgi:hypothetical protein